MTIFILIAVFSPYFEIKKISFVRDDPRLNIEKIEASLEEYYERNLLFLQRKEIESFLQKKFPEIREVFMNETWPSEMELRIVMSPPFTNIFNEETANFWVVSEDGVILEPRAAENLPTIKVFQYKKPIRVSQQFLDKKDLSDIFIAKQFVESTVALQIKEIYLFLVSREIHLITDQGTALWLDLSQEMQPQVKKLKLADEKINLYTEEFEHIDLRIPNQIFYKKR